MPIIFIIIITLVIVVIGIDGARYLLENKIYWNQIKDGFVSKELVVRLRILNRIAGISYIVAATGIFSMFLGVYVSVNG